MRHATILVVDDDPKIRNLLRRCFEAEGSTVHEAADKAAVASVIDAQPVDVITLDLNLGTDDGLDIARAVRAKSKIPIIMVTAKGDVIDRIVGLELGADDYISKPFHIREVVARVKSVLRRVSNGHQTIAGSDGSTALLFDGMVAIPDQLMLRDRDGQQVDMTSGEFKLLEVFLSRPKRVLSRDLLMDLTGGNSYAPMDRTIDNQIARLRKKIERDPATPRLITTIRGIGYSFTCDVERANDYSLANKEDNADDKSD